MEPKEPDSSGVQSPRQVSELECPVCLLPFSPDEPDMLPLLLSCGHSVSVGCCNKIVEQGIIRCPLCRQRTPVPGNDVTELRCNFALCQLMSVLLEEAKEKSSSAKETTITMRDIISRLENPMCCACGKIPATQFCTHCPADIGQEFCEQCAKSNHDGPLVQKHKLVPIAERPLRETKCSKHQERLKYVCTPCKVLICGDCREFDHTGHPVQPVSQVAAQEQDQFKSLLATVHTDVQGLERMLQQDSDCIASLKPSAAECQASIRARAQAIRDLATQREAELCQQVQETCDKECAALEARRKGIAMTRSQCTASAEHAQRTLSPDPIAMLFGKKDAEDSLRSAHASATDWANTHEPAESKVEVELPDIANIIKRWGEVKATHEVRLNAHDPIKDLHFSGKIVQYIIPHDGVYRITARGAQGGDHCTEEKGGRGAVVQGEFKLKANQTLHILCGGMGGASGGGGGGTFVSLNSRKNALLVAGGGGGAGLVAYGLDASLTVDGLDGAAGACGMFGKGGKGGHGGQSEVRPDSNGAGLLTGPPGATEHGPKSFIDGGKGAKKPDARGPFGGFGGGGNCLGGGGGGYSGGGHSDRHRTCGGGGGGSFVAALAANPHKEIGNNGNGSVRIELLK